MAQFFKKRRRGNPGPSKNELKVRRRREADNPGAAGRPLAEEFPGVQGMTLQLDFLTPQRQVLDQQTHAFGAEDVPALEIECLGRCVGEGTFDLTDKIRDAVTARRTMAQFSDVCAARPFPGNSETCGFLLQTTLRLEFGA